MLLCSILSSLKCVMSTVILALQLPNLVIAECHPTWTWGGMWIPSVFPEHNSVFMPAIIWDLHFVVKALTCLGSSHDEWWWNTLHSFLKGGKVSVFLFCCLIPLRRNIITHIRVCREENWHIVHKDTRGTYVIRKGIISNQHCLIMLDTSTPWWRNIFLSNIKFVYSHQGRTGSSARI